MGRILVVGDVVDDLSVRPLGDVTEASDTNAEIRMRPGGSAANVAAWLGHLGADVVLVGRAGADGVARHVAALAAHGVDARIAADPDLTTATIVLHLDGAGERTMFVDRGANRALAAADVPDDVWHGTTWLHLTGYSFFDPGVRPLALSLVRQARERGCGVSVDPSSLGFLRACGAEAFRGWTAGADLFFPNEDEQAYLRLEGPGVVTTLGASGVRCGDLHVPADPPDRDAALDLTGAGDAFAAGFLHRWTRERDLPAALASGVAVAARCVVVAGARPV